MIAHGVALAVTAGAWWRLSFGWLPVVVASIVTARSRQRGWLLVAVLLASGWWAALAFDRFTPPAAGPVDGWVTLTSDPRPSGPTRQSVPRCVPRWATATSRQRTGPALSSLPRSWMLEAWNDSVRPIGTHLRRCRYDGDGA